MGGVKRVYGAGQKGGLTTLCGWPTRISPAIRVSYQISAAQKGAATGGEMPRFRGGAAASGKSPPWHGGGQRGAGDWLARQLAGWCLELGLGRISSPSGKEANRCDSQSLPQAIEDIPPLEGEKLYYEQNHGATLVA